MRRISGAGVQIVLAMMCGSAFAQTPGSPLNIQPSGALAYAPAPAMQPGASTPPSALRELVARYAAHHGVPFALANRVIMRESRYNPRARHRAYWGLMQLRHDTAKGVGYKGPASGLLDAETNLRYGMAYLGNAYRVAGGDQNRAMALYSRGYYYEAKRKGLLRQLRRGD